MTEHKHTHDGHSHVHTHSHGEGEHMHVHGEHTHTHSPEHKKAMLNRMSRIIGHMESVKKMIENDRDCTDVAPCSRSICPPASWKPCSRTIWRLWKNSRAQSIHS